MITKLFLNQYFGAKPNCIHHCTVWSTFGVIAACCCQLKQVPEWFGKMRNRFHRAMQLYFNSLGGSSNLQLHVLVGGLTPKYPISLGGRRPPSDTVRPWTTQVYLPNGMWICRMV